MKSFQFIPNSFVACILMAAAVSGFLDGVNKEVTCKGQKVKNTEMFNKNMGECIAEFKAAKSNKMAGERKRGKSCIGLCALTKDGLFDSNGAFVEAKMMANIDNAVPSDLATILKAEIKNCTESCNMTSVVSNPTDYVCSAYKPFMKCTAVAWMKTCIEGFDPEIWNDE